MRILSVLIDCCERKATAAGNRLLKDQVNNRERRRQHQRDVHGCNVNHRLIFSFRYADENFFHGGFVFNYTANLLRKERPGNPVGGGN